jgi:magnesium and cobalt transporter
MLDFFEANEARVALVVTEDGAPEGLVSINDLTKYLLAGLYGEITEMEAGIHGVDGGFEVDGITPLSQLQQLAGLDVNESSMLTAAGYVLRHFGYVPKLGDQLSYQGLVFTVLEIQNMFISKVKITQASSVNASEDSK